MRSLLSPLRRQKCAVVQLVEGWRAGVFRSSTAQLRAPELMALGFERVTHHRPVRGLWTASFVALSMSLAAPVGRAQAEESAAVRVTTRSLPSVLGYQGTTRGDVDAFLGVRYAAAARWQTPQLLLPPQLDKGAVQAEGRRLVAAQTYPPACAQTPHIVNWYRDVITDFGGDPESFGAPEFAEDCLFLNIWTPKLAQDAALPVIVYIHGGSNRGGWSFEPNYEGRRLAALGAVVVSINYRLDVFGFFAHPAIKDANFALLDQLAALNWVAQYIAYFGGDANNVTVMGESAGASNIDFLLASPVAAGLFHRAIHQSAGWAINGRVSRAEAEALALKLTTQLSPVGQATSAHEALLAVSGVDSAQVLVASQGIYNDYFFDPIAGYASLPKPAAAVFDDTAIHPVDLLIGANADEWLMYLDPEDTVQAALNESISRSKQAAVKQALAGLSTNEALDTLLTAVNYVCPSQRIADAVVTRGGRSWFYYFDKKRQGTLAQRMGAYHGAELPYVFGTHDDWLPTDESDLALSELMMRYWVNFARTGDPNSADLPHWPAFGVTQQSGQIERDVLRLGLSVAPSVHPSQQLCDAL